MEGFGSCGTVLTGRPVSGCASLAQRFAASTRSLCLHCRLLGFSGIDGEQSAVILTIEAHSCTEPALNWSSHRLGGHTLRGACECGAS